MAVLRCPNGCFDLLHVGHIHTLEQATRSAGQRDAAVRDAEVAIGQFNTRCGAAHHRSRQIVREVVLVEAVVQALLAGGDLFGDNGLHSKSFPRGVEWDVSIPIRLRKTPKGFEFFTRSGKNPEMDMLV